MDISAYFKEVKAQKQIDKLAKKYKDKKIVVYGAGEYFKILNNNYDLSKLNIIAICDKKFETSKNSNKTKYLALEPEKLKTFDFDIILVALLEDIRTCNRLEYNFLINTKNYDKKIIPFIEPSLLYGLKVLFSND